MTEKGFSIIEELLFNANDIVFITDIENSTIFYANKMFLDKFEYSKEELFKIDIEKIRKPLENEAFPKLIKQINKTQESTTYSKYFSKSGKKYYLESNNKLQIINNKKYVITIARDITQKIEKEIVLEDKIKEKIKEIENQKLFLHTLLENNPTSIFYKNIEGKYLGCNKAWEKLTGINADEILGKSVYDIAPKDIAQIYHLQDEKVFKLEENPQVYQSEVFNKSENKRFNVVFYKSAFFDSNHKVAGLIGVVIDITDITILEKEKEKKEKLLYQQSKMAAMGEMIENIAHQWRQPLSTMTASASGIKMQKEFGILDETNLNEFLDAILESAKHLSQTIDDFRNFFKYSKNEENFNIKIVFDKTLSLLSSKLKNRNIKIIKQIEEINILALQNELIHVVLNILNNANDALEKINEEEKYIFISCYKENNQAIIEIKDNAKGIEEEILNKIFEPYFTTKHQTNGTGIGLYMSKEIVQKHLYGTIDVQNSTYTYKNKTYTGAKFIIKLPL
ncbi:MEKHLA domain-containing protein [Malaciobacter mytili]|uniref:sensor histidine kinase n=1 Tax=Malaciobacter mytili TaxID=603050 RepID=UPI003BB1B876